MSRKRPYTPQFKAEAVLQVIAAGYPSTRGAVAQVARQLHIPDATLHEWMKHPRRDARPARLAPVPATTSATTPAPTPVGTSYMMSAATTPPDTDTNDMLAFCRNEMALIQVELDKARALASYKDLAATMQALYTLRQQLEAEQKMQAYHNDDLTAQLLKAMDQFAPYQPPPPPEQPDLPPLPYDDAMTDQMLHTMQSILPDAPLSAANQTPEMRAQLVQAIYQFVPPKTTPPTSEDAHNG